ncbi:glycosyltransferase family 2 protein [Marinibaculum pumilum]|uniref:Glycosyltransferase family 2 protein n=1 Tax=Marinibaculum pumilum TaxID=1766165 RepID=A0ABV7KXS4_9PROT
MTGSAMRRDSPSSDGEDRHARELMPDLSDLSDPTGSDQAVGLAGHEPIDVTLFIPCLNEAENVVGAIETVSAACRKLGRSYEVLVFDDGSTDGTSEVVQAWQRANPDAPVRLFRNERNRGVARNFVDGAFAARGHHYRLVCGDNIEPPETHEALLSAIGHSDIVIPYFIEIRNRPFFRKVISWLYTRLVNLASGYRLKYYNGCPIYLRRDVMRFHVETSGFGYQAEFLTRLIYEGRSFVEIPLVAYDREGSASLNLRNLLSVGHSLMTIMFRRLRIVLFE